MPVCLPQFGGCFHSLTGWADVKPCGDDKENSSDRPDIDGSGDAKPTCFVSWVGVESPEKEGNWQHQQEQSRPIKKSSDCRFLVFLRLHACLHEEWHWL